MTIARLIHDLEINAICMGFTPHAIQIGLDGRPLFFMYHDWDGSTLTYRLTEGV